MHGLSKDDIQALAATRYDDAESLEDQLFCLLVDVADTYRDELEKAAAEHAAPFFAGATPLEALIEGLRENLEARRTGH